MSRSLLRGYLAVLIFATPAGLSAQDQTDATDPMEPASSRAPRADVQLRAFGGPCLTSPSGEETQSALIDLLLPKVVGGAFDALSGALQRAGQDRPRKRVAVVPLEYAVDCIQIARGIEGEPTSDGLKSAPFLAEFFLRRSVDGTALLVMPTRLQYRETLNERRSRTKRTLYATLTFRDTTKDLSEVTVPLGRVATRPAEYLFDPRREPKQPGQISALGAGSSIWFPIPFAAADSTIASGQSGGGSNEDAGTAEGSENFGADDPPPPVGERTGAAVSSQSSTIGNQAGMASRAEAQADRSRVAFGTPIAPMSVAVTITEVRPGSPVAKFLHGIVSGSKADVVGLVDPAQRATRRQLQDAATKVSSAALRTARVAYAQKWQTFCSSDAPDQRRSNAPDLWSAQMLLAEASADSGQKPPYEGVVDPETGAVPEGFCRGIQR
jgi:hypothetical protein